MTFRDDHDAAIARAEALEVDVERERDRADTTAKEAADLRRERDRLRAEVATLEQRKNAPIVEPDPPALFRPGSSTGDSGMLWIAVAIVVIFVLTLAMAMNAQ